MKLLPLLLLFSLALPASAENPPYKDPSLPIAQRTEDLLARMTLEEKVAQLTGWWHHDERALLKDGKIFTREFYQEIAPHGLGEVGATNMTIDDDLRQHAVVQDYFLNHTRLGIPALRHGEGAHGLMRLEATSFPAPIGLSCSWNPELVEQLYDHTGREARSRGILHLLSPIVDVVRELRWGRVDETLGEDPYLVSRLGAAMVRGLQGSADGTIAPTHAAATLKHFAGYGASEGGRNRAPYPNGRRLLLDTEIEVFRHIIAASKPASVMPSFNEIDGLPCHVNRWLLTDVLRKDLGFEGLVAADFNGIQRVRLYQKIGADDADAARMAIEAGLQLELPNPWGFSHLKKLVEDEKVDIALVDEAVRAVLRLKLGLGAFELPPLDVEAAKALSNSPRATELAREAARQSIVLLKNEGGLLPLNPAKRIAVIGPNADVCRLGSYSGTPNKTVSLLEGIRSHLGGAAKVTHAKGCIIAKNDTGDSYQNWRYGDDPGFPTPEENQPLIDEAVKTAQAADLVVLALGENAFLAREAWSKGHLGDRTTLDLTEGQQALAHAILATGKPVVLYLMHGKPITEGDIFKQCPAILTGHYAGQETGTAAAEILFGGVNPSGKLTVSWPRSVGHLPAHYNRHASSNVFAYVDSPLTPIFPFGHGLSYTKFKYGKLKLSADTIRAGESIQVSVDLTNTGKRPGTEVVQLYVAGENFPVARPQLELKGFTRITLKPGETKRVTLTLNAEDLYFHDSELQRVLPAGRYLVSIGGSSEFRSKEVPLRVTVKNN